VSLAITGHTSFLRGVECDVKDADKSSAQHRNKSPANDGKHLGTACATSMHDLVEGDGMSKDADEAW
jgi:hypothetical protein